MTFDTLYDDWILANFLDGRAPQSHPTAYHDLTVSAESETLYGASPLLGSGEVTDFGAVYLDFPPADRAAVFQAVIDGADKAPLQAALISWDSEGSLRTRRSLGSIWPMRLRGVRLSAPAGFDRHTLAVWARDTVGSDASFAFRYSCAPDPPAGVQFLDMGERSLLPVRGLPLTLGVVSGREVPVGSGLWFFAGKENVLRKQFAKMIMEAIGCTRRPWIGWEDPSFTDVRPVYDNDGWPLEYPYDYVEEAAALGIVTGYEGGLFKPDYPITRSQLVLMILGEPPRPASRSLLTREARRSSSTSPSPIRAIARS